MSVSSLAPTHHPHLPHLPHKPTAKHSSPVTRRYAEHGVSAGAIRVSDAFVVRYDASAQRSLPVHADDSHFSITLALNGSDAYDGGGTYFEELGVAVRPGLGELVAFPGSLRHGGQAISRGVRYIVAAFLWVEGWAEPAHWSRAT